MAKYTSDSVKALASLMNHAKGQNRPFAFLTGAGCSITAGIPSAPGILKAINDSGLGEAVRQRLGVDDVAKADYGRAMAMLNSQERKEIIGPFLEKAKVNWGHFALAQLMNAGYVGRVLTFNFDSVLARACGLIGLYPAIYDFSMVPEHKGRFDYIAQPSIIHLHGQGTSLTMMNSEEETQKHAAKLEPLFKDTLEQFNLIVTGYSGLADGAFKRLKNCASEQRRLHWCEYNDVAAPEHVQGLIDNCIAMGEYWSGVDFDVLLVELAQELGLFPPMIFKNPAKHLLDEIAPIVAVPAEIKGGTGLLDDLRRKLEGWSTIEPVTAGNRQALMLQQKWQEAIDLGTAEDENEDDKDNLAWAYLMRASKAVSEASFDAALKDFGSALAIKPDMCEALCNWGLALQCLADIRQEEGLYAQSFAKYEAALAIKPDMHEALCNWGTSLGQLAALKQDEDIFAQAFAKYEAALAIKPDLQEAFFNWGTDLGELAAIKQDEDIFAQAFAKYEAALSIKPAYEKALNNWVENLLKFYNITRNKDLLREAEQKSHQVEQLRGKASYNLACVYALQEKEEACRERLLACKADGTLPDTHHLLADEDLSVYRDTAWFKALIESLSGN
jgi:tetratricopeptide (TPR) repeat protein